MLERVDVTEWHNEKMDASGLSIDEERSSHRSVRGEPAEVSWPHLVGSQIRRVNDELVSGFIKSGRCLESHHIRAVTQLRLAVVTKDFMLLVQLVPVHPLVKIALRVDHEGEHRIVHGNGDEALEVVQPAVIRVACDGPRSEEYLRLFYLHESHSAPKIGLSFVDRPVVGLVGVYQSGAYLLHKLPQVLAVLLDVCAAIQIVRELFLIEGNLVSLLL